jgi:hypothetical protein
MAAASSGAGRFATKSSGRNKTTLMPVVLREQARRRQQLLEDLVVGGALDVERKARFRDEMVQRREQRVHREGSRYRHDVPRELDIRHASLEPM